jgi:hypothetical protein
MIHPHLLPKAKKVKLYPQSAKAVTKILEIFLLNVLHYVMYLAEQLHQLINMSKKSSSCKVIVELKDNSN